MYRRFPTLLGILWLFIAIPFAGAQVLELNPAEEEIPLPSASTSSDAIPANPIALPQERLDDNGSENGTALPMREIEGEPIQRGPIHEAFANPLQLTPQASPLRTKAPPAAIEELPPDAKPDVNDVEWIPGYWAWDEQRSDYVWVSGVWRKIPVGRTWVAGRWEQTESGYQWVPGVWMKSGVDVAPEQDELLAAPPESLEQGPTSPAPSDDHFWIPGVWLRNESGQYVWRPGFWSQSQANWVWVPDYYAWRPEGCSYVPGYWDYPWERRGTLYAPCTFASAGLTGRVYYRPSSVIDSTQWLASLWVGPSCLNYYYGDYYDYVGLGYSPWYSYYGRNSRYYDPFYSYYRWRFPISYGIGLYGYLDGLYLYYNQYPSYRPGISFYAGRDWNRRSRGYTSLYGNVDRDRRHDRPGSYDYRDYARNDYARLRGYGNQGRDGDGRDFRNRVNGPRRSGDANGSALEDRNRRGPGITRSDVGTSGARGITRSEIGQGRSTVGEGRGGPDRGRAGIDQRRTDVDRGRRDIERSRGALEQRALEQRNRASVDARGPRTNNNTGRNAGPRTLATPSPGPIRGRTDNPSSRSNERLQGRPSGPRADASRNLRSGPTVDIPRASQPRQNPSRPAPNVSRPAPNVSRPAPNVSRPAPNVSRPRQGAPRSSPNVSRARPTASGSEPGVSRPSSNVSRPAPQVSRPRASAQRPSPQPSSPGFSTHGMKKARGEDLVRQRAAMQKHVADRKKK